MGSFREAALLVLSHEASTDKAIDLAGVMPLNYEASSHSIKYSSLGACEILSMG